MKVNQVPSTREEDRTEVLQEEEEEEAITKPAAEGTGIPHKTRPSQSTINHTTTTKTSPNHIYESLTVENANSCSNG